MIIWAFPCFAGSAHSPLYPQLMLWFTYYKGTFSTFVFASQNRAFMLRSWLRHRFAALHAPNAPPSPIPSPIPFRFSFFAFFA
jgi:hypothetical protein